MADQGKKQGKGGGARKYGQNERKPTHKGQSARTATNKARRIARDAAKGARGTARRMSENFIDPVTGKKLRKCERRTKAIERRIEQEVKVKVKRIGRQNFRQLSPSEKIEHRRAGAEHRTPRDLQKDKGKTPTS